MTYMDIIKDDARIFKSCLNPEKLPIARLLNNRALEDYMATTSLREDNDKRHSFTLFNKYKVGGFGYSALQKKNAAQALYDVVHNGADMNARCSPEDIKALNNGRLKLIYRQYLEIHALSVPFEHVAHERATSSKMPV